MESVLHIQPITRQITKPLTIGHVDYISLGEKHLDGEEDPLGEHATLLRIGCPLEEIDHGSARSHVPLVKTFEAMRDPDRRDGDIYLETIHYFKDETYLIPIRTKIQSGYSSGERFGHLPSLNYIRGEICGMRWPFGEVRSSIVTNLLEHDSYFVKNHNSPVMDWLKNDLTNHLNSSQITDSEFSGKRLERMAYRFRNMVEATPHDVNQAHLKDLLRTIDLERHVYPTSLYSQDVISHPIKDVRRFMIFNPFDLSSQGKIPIHKIPCMLQDPPAFKDIADIFDTIPLTDFNVDVIFSVDNQILFRHDHVALHRMAAFKDHNIGAFSTESLLSSLVNEDTLTAILKLFVQHHHLLDDDTRMILNTQPIKIKLMKTIEDEACVILFKYNSSSKDDPLCGVHFDIALQALAPITVMPAAIDF